MRLYIYIYIYIYLNQPPWKCGENGTCRKDKLLNSRSIWGANARSSKDAWVTKKYWNKERGNHWNYSGTCRPWQLILRTSSRHIWRQMRMVKGLEVTGATVDWKNLGEHELSSNIWTAALQQSNSTIFMTRWDRSHINGQDTDFGLTGKNLWILEDFRNGEKAC